MSNYRKTMTDALREMYPLTEETQLDEATMSSSQIARLKKAYEPMRDKKISVSNADKLSAMMDKVGKDKEALIQLFKADIPFVSQSAVTKLITKHNMKGAEINKLREEVELDEDMNALFFALWGGSAMVVLPALMLYNALPPKVLSKLNANSVKAVGNLLSKFKKDKNYKPTSAELDDSKKLENEVKNKEPSIFKKAMSKLKSIKSKKEEVDLDEGKLGDQWQKGAKSVKSGSFELVRGKSGVHDIMKSGKKIGTFSYDDEGDNFVANMKGERGQLVGNDIDTLISNFKEEVDLDEVDRSTYSDRIKRFTGFLKDAEKEKPLDKEWIKLLKRRIEKERADLRTDLKRSTRATTRKELGFNREEVDLDENRMSQLHQMIKDKKSAEEIAKEMKLDVKTVKALMNSHHPEDVEESAASDARRAMRRDKDFSRKDSADDDTNATDDDIKGASKNIMMQMRKAQSLNGRFDVEFADKKKVKIPAKMAIAVQQKYNSMKRPAEKEKFQAKIGKSYKDMLSALKEELQPKKESILERMNRKIKENKDG